MSVIPSSAGVRASNWSAWNARRKAEEGAKPPKGHAWGEAGAAAAHHGIPAGYYEHPDGRSMMVHPTGVLAVKLPGGTPKVIQPEHVKPALLGSGWVRKGNYPPPKAPSSGGGMYAPKPPPEPPKPLPELGKVWGVDRTKEYLGRDLHAEGEFPSDPKKGRYGMVVFNEKGQVLLREPKGHFSGMVWTLPKGHRDGAEHPVETARRETLEETGLNAAVVGHVPEAFAGSTGTDHFYLGHVDTSQHPEWLNNETDALTWADPSDAEELMKMSTNAVARERDLWALHGAVKAHAHLYPSVSTPLPPRTQLTVAPTVALPKSYSSPKPPSAPHAGGTSLGGAHAPAPKTPKAPSLFGEDPEDAALFAKYNQPKGTRSAPLVLPTIFSTVVGTRDWATWDLKNAGSATGGKGWKAAGAANFAKGRKAWGHHAAGGHPMGPRRAGWTEQDKAVVAKAHADAQALPKGKRFTGKRAMTDAEYEQHQQHIEHELAAHGANDLMRSPYSTHISEDRVGGVDGVYTPEREALHRKIINEIMANAAEVPNEKHAIVAAGLGGAGKSTTLRKHAKDPNSVASKLGIKYRSYDEQGNGVGEPTNFLTLNPDDIKEKLAQHGAVPEIGHLSPMEAAAFIHEEASHVTNKLAQRALAEGKNHIWDITLSSTKSGDVRIAPLKQHGYTVDGMMVDVSRDQSVKNALQRHKHGQEEYLQGKGHGGRYVPPEFMRQAVDPKGEYRSSNRRSFETIKAKGGFDHTVTIDNEGYAGKLIDQSGFDAGKRSAQDWGTPPLGPIGEQIVDYNEGRTDWPDLLDFLATYDYATPSHLAVEGGDERTSDDADRNEPGTWGEVSTAHARGQLTDDEYDTVVRAIGTNLDPEPDDDTGSRGLRSWGVRAEQFTKNGTLNHWYLWNLKHPYIHKGVHHGEAPGSEGLNPSAAAWLAHRQGWKAKQASTEQVTKGALPQGHYSAYEAGHKLGYGVGFKMAGNSDVEGLTPKQLVNKTASLYVAAVKAKEAGDYEEHARLLGAAHGFAAASKEKAAYDKAHGVTPAAPKPKAPAEPAAPVTPSVATSPGTVAESVKAGDVISIPSKGISHATVQKVGMGTESMSLFFTGGKATGAEFNTPVVIHSSAPVTPPVPAKPKPVEQPKPKTVDEHVTNAINGQHFDWNSHYDDAVASAMNGSLTGDQLKAQAQQMYEQAQRATQAADPNSSVIAAYHAAGKGYEHAAKLKGTTPPPAPAPAKPPAAAEPAPPQPANPFAAGSTSHSNFARAYDEATAHAQTTGMTAPMAKYHGDQFEHLAKGAGGFTKATMMGSAAGYHAHAAAKSVQRPSAPQAASVAPAAAGTTAGLTDAMTAGMLQAGDKLPSGHTITKVHDGSHGKLISVLGPTGLETNHSVPATTPVNQLIAVHEQKAANAQAQMPAASHYATALSYTAPVQNIVNGDTLTTSTGKHTFGDIEKLDALNYHVTVQGPDGKTTMHQVPAGTTAGQLWAAHHAAATPAAPSAPAMPKMVSPSVAKTQATVAKTPSQQPAAAIPTSVVPNQAPKTEAELSKLTPMSQGQTFSNGEKVPGTGTSGGQWYDDGQGGAYFLKGWKSDAHSMNEVAGSLAYQQAGVPTQPVTLVKMANGKLRALAHYQTGLKPVTPSNITPELQAEARKGFGMDALLSHYDVFGAPGDSSGRNLFKTADGTVVRLDLGGSGRFRAMGEPKKAQDWSEGDWGKYPSNAAYDTLRDSEQGKLTYGAPTSATLASKIAELNASLAKAANFDADAYRGAMVNAGISPQFADSQVAIIKARQEHLQQMLPASALASAAEPQEPREEFDPYTAEPPHGDEAALHASAAADDAAHGGSGNTTGVPQWPAFDSDYGADFKQGLESGYNDAKTALAGQQVAGSTYTADYIKQMVEQAKKTYANLSSLDPDKKARYAGLVHGGEIALLEHDTGTDHSDYVDDLINNHVFGGSGMEDMEPYGDDEDAFVPGTEDVGDVPVTPAQAKEALDLYNSYPGTPTGPGKVKDNGKSIADAIAQVTGQSPASYAQFSSMHTQLTQMVAKAGSTSSADQTAHVRPGVNVKALKEGDMLSTGHTFGQPTEHDGLVDIAVTGPDGDQSAQTVTSAATAADVALAHDLAVGNPPTPGLESAANAADAIAASAPHGVVPIIPHGVQKTQVSIHTLKPGHVLRGVMGQLNHGSATGNFKPYGGSGGGEWKVVANRDATKPGDTMKKVRITVAELDANGNETGQTAYIASPAHLKISRYKVTGAKEKAATGYTPMLSPSSPWPADTGVGAGAIPEAPAGTKKLTSVMSKNLHKGDKVLVNGKPEVVDKYNPMEGGWVTANGTALGHGNGKVQKLTPAHPLFNATSAAGTGATTPSAVTASVAGASTPTGSPTPSSSSAQTKQAKQLASTLAPLSTKPPANFAEAFAKAFHLRNWGVTEQLPGKSVVEDDDLRQMPAYNAAFKAAKAHGQNMTPDEANEAASMAMALRKDGLSASAQAAALGGAEGYAAAHVAVPAAPTEDGGPAVDLTTLAGYKKAQKAAADMVAQGATSKTLYAKAGPLATSDDPQKQAEGLAWQEAAQHADLAENDLPQPDVHGGNPDLTPAQIDHMTKQATTGKGLPISNPDQLQLWAYDQGRAVGLQIGNVALSGGLTAADIEAAARSEEDLAKSTVGLIQAKHYGAARMLHRVALAAHQGSGAITSNTSPLTPKPDVTYHAPGTYSGGSSGTLYQGVSDEAQYTPDEIKSFHMFTGPYRFSSSEAKPYPGCGAGHSASDFYAALNALLGGITPAPADPVGKNGTYYAEVFLNACNTKSVPSVMQIYRGTQGGEWKGQDLEKIKALVASGQTVDFSLPLSSCTLNPGVSIYKNKSIHYYIDQGALTMNGTYNHGAGEGETNTGGLFEIYKIQQMGTKTVIYMRQKVHYAN